MKSEYFVKLMPLSFKKVAIIINVPFVSLGNGSLHHFANGSMFDSNKRLSDPLLPDSALFHACGLSLTYSSRGRFHVQRLQIF